MNDFECIHIREKESALGIKYYVYVILNKKTGKIIEKMVNKNA